MNQKEATYSAITNVLADAGVDFEDGMNVKPLLTKEMKSSVYQILIAGFTKGQIEISEDFDKSKLPTYVSGLVSNWLNKDKRLNGNTVFQHKNPGSRAGGSDSQIKALRDLKKITSSPEDLAKIEAAIQARMATIKPSKTVTINAEDVPEELRYLLEK